MTFTPRHICLWGWMGKNLVGTLGEGWGATVSTLLLLAPCWTGRLKALFPRALASPFGMALDSVGFRDT